MLLGEHDGELAAIKILKNADLLDERERRRFDQEIINLKKLDHPVIPKIIDLDVVDAMQPWIATAYVSGPTLQEQVNEKRPLKLDEWVKALKEITSALVYVHSNGIYHRDISPSNIILNESGAKLIDFGMSYLENTQTFSKSIMNVQGTPATLSPESLAFKKDPKMDMFSLGSTFVFAGSGNFPFDAENQDASWMYKLANDSPSFHNIPKEMETLLTPLFYKDPRDRISSSEYLEILEKIDLTKPNTKVSEKVLDRYLINAQTKLKSKSFSESTSLKSSKKRAIVLSSLAMLFFAIFILNNSETTMTSESTISSSNTSDDSSSITPTASSTISTEAKEKNDNSVTSKDRSAVESCYRAVESDRQNVRALCTVAATKGDLKSIWYLGTEYLDSGNYKSAIEWFLKGAVKDDYQSMLGLVKSYEKSGLETERLKWLETCAKGFYGISANSPKSTLGTCKLFYAMELNRTEKKDQAILYLKDAIKYGNSDAATYLGIIYRDQGKLDLALKSYEDGVRLGSETALAELIRILEERGDQKGINTWLTVAAEKGDENAKRSLAARYYFLDKDKVNARKWALQCGKAGIGECNFILGELATGEKQDLDAKKYYLLAHNQGIDRASIKLAAIYWLKENDLVEAKKVLQKLLAKGDFLATSMMVGISLDSKDIFSACTFAKQASELAEKKKKSGDWTSEDSKYLESNEKVLNDLCKISS